MPILSQVNPYYVLILIFVVVFSGFILSLLHTIYYYLHKRHQSDGSSADPRDIAVHEAVKIVESARGHAIEMLSEAHEEVKVILHDSEEVHSSVKETFDTKMQAIGQKQMQAFDQMSHDLVESYKAVLQQEKDASLQTLTGISTTLKTELSSDVTDFKEKIRTITTETEDHIKNDISSQFGSISSQLSSLKDSLGRISQEAEQNMKNSLSGDTNLVKQEITSFAEKIRQVSAEAEAQMKASLGGDTDLVKQEIEGFAQRIKVVSDETEKTIKEELSQEYDEAKSVIHNLSDDLKRIITETETELKQGVKAEYDQVRQELENYKKDRYAKVDSVVRGMLEEVARDVIGKTLNAHDHEELIIKSLDSIKRTTSLKEL